MANMYVKRCSISLIIRVMKSEQEDIISYLLGWLLSKRKEINVGENLEKRGPLYSIGGNIKLC